MNQALPALFRRQVSIRPVILFASFLLTCLLFWRVFAAIAGTPGILHGPWSLESMGYLKKVEFRIYWVSVLGIPLLSLLLGAIFTTLLPIRAAKYSVDAPIVNPSHGIKRFILTAAAPIAFYVLSLAPHINGPVEPVDEGLRLAAVNQFQNGKLPYREIYFQYGPGLEIFQSLAAFKYFGDSLEAQRQMDRFIAPLGNVAGYFLVLVLFGGSWWVLLFPLLFLGNVNFWILARAALPLASLACLISSEKSADDLTRRRKIFLAGMLSTFALFYSLEGGTLLFPAVALYYGALALRGKFLGERSWQAPLHAAWLYGAAAALAGLPALLWLVKMNAVAPFLKNSFFVGTTLLARWGKPTPPISGPLLEWIRHPFLIFQWAGGWQRWWFPPFFYAAVLTYALWRGTRSLLLLAIAGLFFFVVALARTDYDHWLKGTTLLWPLMLAAIDAGWKWRPALKGDRRLSNTLTILLLAYFVWFIHPQMILLNMASWSHHHWRMGTPSTAPSLARLGAANVGPDQEILLTGVVERIHKLAPAGTEFYIFSEDPVYYYLANVINPTRFASVSYASGDEMIDEVIADLKARRPNGIMARTEGRHLFSQPFHSKIRDFIQENYQPVDHFGPYVFLSRKS